MQPDLRGKVAVVTGAAVASVHIRAIMRDNLSTFGWVLVWATFTWIAITAAGPFVFLVRRFIRPDRPASSITAG